MPQTIDIVGLNVAVDDRDGLVALATIHVRGFSINGFRVVDTSDKGRVVLAPKWFTSSGQRLQVLQVLDDQLKVEIRAAILAAVHELKPDPAKGAV